MPPDPGWTPPLPRSGGTSSWLYPIMIILGFVIAIVLSCIKMWKRYKIKIEPFYWFILIGVPVAILGANFGSCVLGEPAGKPWSKFFSDFGSGLAIEWGVLFTVIAGLIYFPLVLKKEKYRVRDELGAEPAVRQVSTWLYFDAVIPCVLLAQFLGRWGNYFNQEVYGAALKANEEGLAWFLYKCLPGMYIKGAWRQPLFLWEGLGNLAMSVILYVGLEFVKVRKAGDMTAAYFIWYGIFRACLEPLRDSTFKSTVSIVVSWIFFAVGVIFVVLNHCLYKKVRRVKLWQSFKALFNKPVSTSSEVHIGSTELKINNDVNGNMNTKPSRLILRKDNEMLYYCGY